jgi:hypothetical protein
MELAQSILMRETIFQTLKANKELLIKYHITQIGLFGSYVRNEQTENSDIDFLVDFEPGWTTFRNYTHLISELEDLFHKKIDLIIKDSIKPALKTEILGSVEYATFP